MENPQSFPEPIIMVDNYEEDYEEKKPPKPKKPLLNLVHLTLKSGQRLPPPLSKEPPAKITLSDIGGNPLAPGLSIPNVFQPNNVQNFEQEGQIQDENIVQAPQIPNESFEED